MVAPGSSGHDPGVDFAQAQQVFLTPPGSERPAARVPDTPARGLRDAAEPIATISIWGRPLNERLSALGLDFLTGYVWARAAPMGEPAAPAVVAAFGVFEPGLITGLYEEARSKATRGDVLAAHAQGAVESLRALLPDADVTDAALRCAAAPTSPRSTWWAARSSPASSRCPGRTTPSASSGTPR
jgi:hypothetical protein